jgi:hypothetical protein
MLRIKERLLRAWLAYKRLTGLSFPRRFPIVQFPNLPLIVAVLAGAAGKFLDGSAHSYAASVSYLAMTIWAYEQLVHGVNWFRRLLGLAYVILLIVRVADACAPDLCRRRHVIALHLRIFSPLVARPACSGLTVPDCWRVFRSPTTGLPPR